MKRSLARRKKRHFGGNLRLARELWPDQIHKGQVESLRTLSGRYLFSVAVGDLQLLDGRWYVTHSGLIGLSQRRDCFGIQVRPLREFCNPAANRWVFKATVYKSLRSKGFVGYGDADPSNVSPLVRGAEMRVAETRAVNRALRKAYGIGLCSVEELGWAARCFDSGPEKDIQNSPGNNAHGQPRLRDQLCLLIRQHQLDPALVKRCAADFCGTENLRQASRDRVEAFIKHLGEWATRDREGLVCKLDSYAQAPEVSS